MMIFNTESLKNDIIDVHAAAVAVLVVIRQFVKHHKRDTTLHYTIKVLIC